MDMGQADPDGLSRVPKGRSGLVPCLSWYRPAQFRQSGPAVRRPYGKQTGSRESAGRAYQRLPGPRLSIPVQLPGACCVL